MDLKHLLGSELTVVKLVGDEDEEDLGFLEGFDGGRILFELGMDGPALGVGEESLGGRPLVA